MKEPFLRPVLEDFLEENYWGIHEAAFVLTDCWPKYEFPYSTISTYPPRELKRKHFYAPTSDKFSPCEYGQLYQEIYQELTEAVLKGELAAIQEYLFANVSLILIPNQVVVWALINGKKLPDNLQKALGFLQSTVRQLCPYLTKVRDKVIGQYILQREPTLKDNVKAIMRHSLMKQHSDSIEGKSLKDDINTLFESPGKPGRRSSKKTNSHVEDGRIYVLKPIPEVKTTINKGMVSYNFKLLEVAIKTAVKIIIYSDQDRYSKMTFEDVEKKIMEDKIIQLYVHESTEIVLSIIKRVIQKEIQVFQDILMWQKFSSLDREIKLPVKKRGQA